MPVERDFANPFTGERRDRLAHTDYNGLTIIPDMITRRTWFDVTIHSVQSCTEADAKLEAECRFRAGLRKEATKRDKYSSMMQKLRDDGEQVALSIPVFYSEGTWGKDALLLLQMILKEQEAIITHGSWPFQKRSWSCMTFRDEIIQDVSCALAKWHAHAILRCAPRTRRFDELDNRFSVNAVAHAELANKTLPQTVDVDPFKVTDEELEDYCADHLP